MSFLEFLAIAYLGFKFLGMFALYGLGPLFVLLVLWAYWRTRIR